MEHHHREGLTSNFPSPLISGVVAGIFNAPCTGPLRDLYRGRCFGSSIFNTVPTQAAPLLRKKEPLLFHSRGSFCGKQFGSDEEPDQQCQPRSPQQQNEQGKVPFLSQALIQALRSTLAAAHKHIVQMPPHWDKIRHKINGRKPIGCRDASHSFCRPRRVPVLQCHKHRRDLRSHLLRSLLQIHRPYFPFRLSSPPGCLYRAGSTGPSWRSAHHGCPAR